MRRIINTNKTLKQIFDRLNRQHFGGKLKATVRFADLTEIEADGAAYGSDEIEIDSAFKYVGAPHVELVLLHEMVHAELPHAEHSMRFQARLVELFDKGAYDGLL